MAVTRLSVAFSKSINLPFRLVLAFFLIPRFTSPLSVENIGVEPGAKRATGMTLLPVENIGVEPMTPCLQSRCSSQLS